MCNINNVNVNMFTFEKVFNQCRQHGLHSGSHRKSVACRIFYDTHTYLKIHTCKVISMGEKKVKIQSCYC